MGAQALTIYQPTIKLCWWGKIFEKGEICFKRNPTAPKPIWNQNKTILLQLLNYFDANL